MNNDRTRRLDPCRPLRPPVDDTHGGGEPEEDQQADECDGHEHENHLVEDGIPTAIHRSAVARRHSTGAVEQRSREWCDFGTPSNIARAMPRCQYGSGGHAVVQPDTL